MKQWELRGVTIERARTQRPMEVQTREQAEAPRAVPDQFPASIWTTDRSLRLTSLRGAELPSVVDPRPRIGTLLLDLFDEDGWRFLVIDAHVRALAGESVAFEIEWAGGRFGCRVSPLLDAEGRCIGTITVAVDLSGGSEARRLDEPRRLAAVG